MHLLEIIIGFFLGMAFWPSLGILATLTYIYAMREDDNHGPEWFFFPLALTIAVAKYWDALNFTTVWHCTVYYLAAGGAVCLLKWMSKCIAFQERLAKLGAKKGFDCLEYSEKKKVIISEDKESVRLDPSMFPLKQWWVLWPMFILSVIVEPCVRWARRVFDRISMMFGYTVADAHNIAEEQD